MNQRPNILFIMADDHASKAIGCYGHGINATPGIDRLAQEGMRFNHCYVTNSICTPSRATILTGTHNHVNDVVTLDSKFNNRLPHVAKHLRSNGYQTAMIGKWHLGEGKAHEPSGFDHWSVLPGQGEYHDPVFLEPAGKTYESGYATDIITEKASRFIRERDRSKPFFMMCHHKAPHRPWEPHPRHKHLFQERISVPDTFSDDYKNRARAAAAAKMRVADDMTYRDVGVVQPEGGREVGEPQFPGAQMRKLPNPQNIRDVRLIDKDTGEVFTFQNEAAYTDWKFQRYMQRYLRTLAAVDESVATLLQLLDDEGIAENTLVIYTSDQGFFLGEHGWFDKRFMYEESFQMPFLVRYPREIPPGTICNDIASNVDFAPTFLDIAGIPVPTYMQGRSLRPLLKGATPTDWSQVAYHRYWMHRDAIHNAYAHYGIRTQQYKLVYWYNQGLGAPGSQGGGEAPEWELFDCNADPLELINVYDDPAYRSIVHEMTALLDRTMAEIGDEPRHAASSIAA
ncbi:sulfatase [Ideonella azotifigens]|uniref:Sulfatase n=1 Tax=Ideonella azotifigens TaxID=513160 RepID=A0ABP3VFZ2_9BURK|nr:sulfatase [Ideonella azotifigens]MCD2342924.1 sulfatase [Ideonella azotifigens]